MRFLKKELIHLLNKRSGLRNLELNQLSNLVLPAPDPQVAQLVRRVQVAHDRLGALRQGRYQDGVLEGRIE